MAKQVQARYAITPLETLRHFGTVKALQLVVLKVLRVRPVVLMARSPQPTGPEDYGSANDDHGIRRATLDDGGLFEAAGFPRDMLATKLAEGPGWLQVVDGRLVGWNFLGLQQSAIANWLILRSSKTTAMWSTGTWVHQDLRGRGLLHIFAGLGADWGLANGYSEVLSWVDQTNHASIRGTLKLGCRIVGRVTIVLRLLGWALVHDGRHWHLGRWTASRPLVLLLERICSESASHDAAADTAPGREPGSGPPEKDQHNEHVIH